MTDAQKEQAAQERRDRSLQRRITRDLKKMYESGKVSSFLKKQSEDNESVKSAVALAQVKNPLEFVEQVKAQVTAQLSQPPIASPLFSQPPPIERIGWPWRDFDVCENGQPVIYRIPCKKIPN